MRNYRPTQPLTLTYYAARRYGADMALLPAHVAVSGLPNVAPFDIPVSGTLTYALAREVVLYVCEVRRYDVEDVDLSYVAGDLTDKGSVMAWASDLTPDAPLVLVAD